MGSARRSVEPIAAHLSESPYQAHLSDAHMSAQLCNVSLSVAVPAPTEGQGDWPGLRGESHEDTP